MDFKILYAIQSIRTPFLDKFIVLVTNICGNYGQMWLALGVFMLIFKKTRRYGLTIIASYLLIYASTEFIFKDLIARARPCHIDQTIELLVSRPSSYSCPSTHSAWSFASATSVYLCNKKCGIFAYTVACLIAFSRMYLFVHFPTDILFGIILGILCTFLCKYLFEKLFDILTRK